MLHAHPTTTAQSHVFLTCDCPSCGETVQLYKPEYNLPIPLQEIEAQFLDRPFECPHCHIPFIVTRITC